MNFKSWIIETYGPYAIASCKNKNNPSLKFWGALSDLNCDKKKKKRKKKSNS